MNRAIVPGVFLLSLACMICGCSESSSEKSTSENGSGDALPVADTPMKALERLARSLATADTEAFRAGFVASEEQAELLEAYCEYIVTARQLSKAMKRAYGEYGSGESRSISVVPGETALFTEAWRKGISVKVHDELAGVSGPGTYVGPLMVKDGPVWKIETDSILGWSSHALERSKMGEYFRAMTEQMSEAQRKIDRPDCTAQKIIQELEEAELDISDRFLGDITYTRSEEDRCLAQIEYLGLALRLYAGDHDGKYPDSEQWQELLLNGGFTRDHRFICPAAAGEPEEVRNDYVFVPWPVAGLSKEYDAVTKRDLLFLFERKANHGNRRAAVTFAQYRVLIDEAEFRKKLAITIEKLKARGIDFQWSD